ncbi:uncharacterized protein LOC128861260 [Anastrepha ludens]|uniref:uncharacterized protein LOC128861260 n=1 Tax=Anastrepha ludens TaxID=28586 RepID=UPI0023B1D17A|nr:uncharacterized protein LOC128861260 [Anastrepha ludens]
MRNVLLQCWQCVQKCKYGSTANASRSKTPFLYQTSRIICRKNFNTAAYYANMMSDENDYLSTSEVKLLLRVRLSMESECASGRRKKIFLQIVNKSINCITCHIGSVASAAITAHL